jgi:hypothetical protein
MLKLSLFIFLVVSAASALTEEEANEKLFRKLEYDATRLPSMVRKTQPRTASTAEAYARHEATWASTVNPATTTVTTAPPSATSTSPTSPASEPTSRNRTATSLSPFAFFYGELRELHGLYTSFKSRLFDVSNGVSLTAFVLSIIGTVSLALLTAIGSSFFVYIRIGKRIYELKLNTDSRFSTVADYLVNLKRMCSNNVETVPHCSIHHESERDMI